MLDDKFVSEGKEGVLPRYVLQILTLIEEAGYEAYVVGGAVRDIALGLAPHDFDVASSAFPDEMIEVLSAAGIPIGTVLGIGLSALVYHGVLATGVAETFFDIIQGAWQTQCF